MSNFICGTGGLIIGILLGAGFVSMKIKLESERIKKEIFIKMKNSFNKALESLQEELNSSDFESQVLGKEENS